MQNVNTVIDWVRKKEIPTFFIQYINMNSSDEMKVGEQGCYLLKGIHRTKEDKVIQKFTWDAFYSTDLAELLKFG